MNSGKIFLILTFSFFSVGLWSQDKFFINGEEVVIQKQSNSFGEPLDPDFFIQLLTKKGIEFYIGPRYSFAITKDRKVAFVLSGKNGLYSVSGLTIIDYSETSGPLWYNLSHSAKSTLTIDQDVPRGYLFTLYKIASIEGYQDTQMIKQNTVKHSGARVEGIHGNKIKLVFESK